MTIDNQKLTEYSLGQLDEAERLALKKQLTQSQTAEQELKEVQAALEAFATSAPPVKPSNTLKQSILATLNKTTPFEGYTERFMALFDLNKEQVRELLKKAAAVTDNTFKPSGIPGAQLFYFNGGPRVSSATCGLLKLEPGRIFPAHQHQGNEHALILQGSAIDQSGQSYHPGDVMHYRKGSSHAFRADDTTPLIFAVVLDKPNKWLLGRIVLDYLFSKKRFTRPTSSS